MEADIQICVCGREVEGQLEQSYKEWVNHPGSETYNIFECECGEVWDDLEEEEDFIQTKAVSGPNHISYSTMNSSTANTMVYYNPYLYRREQKRRSY